MARNLAESFAGINWESVVDSSFFQTLVALFEPWYFLPLPGNKTTIFRSEKFEKYV